MLSLTALWLAAHVGAFFRKKLRPFEEEAREGFVIVQGATLTMLSLLTGFSFSMADSRYNQRRHCEEAEANAIGAEYVRAELLPGDDAARVRDLLRKYLDQRVLFYTTYDVRQRRIEIDTAKLTTEMWSAVQIPATKQPGPTVALAVSGMNEVLNSQGFTQAAWRNRIPAAACVLLATIALGCNLLIGYGARRPKNRLLFLILPFAVAVSFFLIADIDSPRGGIIRVQPQNLISLSHSLG